jgi:tRNA nucleotidyltransferase (CCA-adding enzyme)
MKGRDGLEDAPYPQAARLLAALDAATAVDPRALVAEGLAGEALGEALRERRIAAIAAACPREG